MKQQALDEFEEMFNKLAEIPDKWFRGFKGFIMVCCTGKNVGVNASLNLLELTDDQKIGIISMVAKKLGLDYEILRDYMDVKLSKW